MINEHQPNYHLESHNKGNNINKELDEDAEEVHLVGDDKSSTDENFGINEDTIQHAESEDDSDYESTQEMSNEEDNISVEDPSENPVENPQRPLMLREMD